MTRMRTRKQLRCLTSAYCILLPDRGSDGDLTTACSILREELGEGRDIFLSGGCNESEDEDEDVSDEDMQLN